MTRKNDYFNHMQAIAVTKQVFQKRSKTLTSGLSRKSLTGSPERGGSPGEHKHRLTHKHKHDAEDSDEILENEIEILKTKYYAE